MGLVTKPSSQGPPPNYPLKAYLLIDVPPLPPWQVQVVASLPCYTEKTVNMQRGKTVFQRSIAGLKKLNALG